MYEIGYFLTSASHKYCPGQIVLKNQNTFKKKSYHFLQILKPSDNFKNLTCG